MASTPPLLQSDAASPIHPNQLCLEPNRATQAPSPHEPSRKIATICPRRNQLTTTHSSTVKPTDHAATTMESSAQICRIPIINQPKPNPCSFHSRKLPQSPCPAQPASLMPPAPSHLRAISELLSLSRRQDHREDASCCN
ncbi:hypothetical protein M0R45_030795 [Rubus argutus]|uniref:Uncharacterized protein n=1 Tax=Rubus argutus TaxID=59490 RepID=A0AAW1WEJ5_RUBAR